MTAATHLLAELEQRKVRFGDGGAGRKLELLRLLAAATLPSARSALLRLAERADVLVHNYRPPSLARLGIDYATIRAVNPRVIYCGTYGFSRRGPYGHRAAYDDSIQAASGVAMLSAMVEGEPRYVPTILADKTTALAVVGAVTAALYHREKHGIGQEIEVPMFETMVSYVMTEHLYGRVFEPPEGPAGYARVLSRHRRPYRTRDGYLAVLPYLDEHWRTFCALADRDDLAEDARFATLDSRIAHIDAVYAETARVIATRTTAEWLEVFRHTDIPVTVLRSLDDLLDDEHLGATGFWQIVEHPTEGQLRLPGIPMTFSETPGSVRRPPPRLGEHSLRCCAEQAFPTATLRPCWRPTRPFKRRRGGQGNAPVLGCPLFLPFASGARQLAHDATFDGLDEVRSKPFGWDDVVDRAHALRAVLLVCLLLTMPAGLNAILERVASNTRIAVHNKAGIVYAMPYSFTRKVRQVEGVAAAMAQVWFGGAYEEEGRITFPSFAVEVEHLGAVYPVYNVPPEQLAELQRYRDGAIVGRQTMNRYGWKIGERVTLRSNVWPVALDFRIVGEIPNERAPHFWMSREYLDEALKAQGRAGLGITGVIWVRAGDPARVNAIMREIDDMSRNSEAETACETQKSFFSNFFASLQGLVTIILVVTGLVPETDDARADGGKAAREVGHLRGKPGRDQQDVHPSSTRTRLTRRSSARATVAVSGWRSTT